MKLFLFANLIMLTSCVSSKAPCPPAKVDTIVVGPAQTALPTTIHDTIFIPRQPRGNYDSLRMVTDTLAARLLHSRLVISNVRYYLNLAIKSPSQDKFLKGWIRRALE